MPMPITCWTISAFAWRKTCNHARLTIETRRPASVPANFLTQEQCIVASPACPCNQGMVTTGQGNAASPARADDFATAWRELRADDEIQFTQVTLPETDPRPDWLTEFQQWLGEIFTPVAGALVEAWPVLKWVLIGLAVLIAAYFLYQTLGPGFRRKRRNVDDPQDWSPQEHEALALLEEADRLAAGGDYDEATHLLLKRSVGQIAEARPDLVEPSSTARELAAEPRLPDAARTAFSLIAAPVERSLFALRKLEKADWQAARAAYSDFALARKAIGA